MAITLIVLWILLTGGFIGIGVTCESLGMVLLGLISLFGFFIIGEVCRLNNSHNKGYDIKFKQREKKIEKEYGIIDYFDKDDKD